MTRLSPDSLHLLPGEVAVPRYDRDQPCGVFHIGTGAFHRAHQAAYFDWLLAAGHHGWMIRGASLRSDAVARSLNPQQGLFCLAERDGKDTQISVVGSIRDVLVGPHDPDRLVAALAAPEVAMVTLTITEKGYEVGDAPGDAEGPARTAPGLLVAALARRRASGTAPFTILSCDNLAENGRQTRACVLAQARRQDSDLADWIEREVAFPSSMVDRIVPATTPEDIAALAEATGLRDEAMVKTEPFSQWVVEDRFCNRRPPLETVGVEMVRDVVPWEMAKLRLLNGAHSAIAYLGGLAGHEYVHQTVGAPGFARLVETLWDEAAATLPPIAGFDAVTYRKRLTARFANAALEHRTAQIAMDGSRKIPHRWLGPIREFREKRGAVPEALALALAGWMRWQSGHGDGGQTHTVEDPLAAQTANALAGAGSSSADQVRALLSIAAIFPADLIRDEPLVEQVVRYHARLGAIGAAKTVAGFGGAA